MNTYFISDTHFGHANIMKFEPEFRPFTHVDEMNEHIIQEWNKIVSPLDEVYHLGDVYFGSKSNLSLVTRLNGKKKLVLGNHDTHTTMQEFNDVGFVEIYGMLKFRKTMLITHAPVHPDELQYGATHNIHGHTHGRLIKDKFGKPDARYINVCVERANYKPVHVDELLAYQKRIIGA